MHNRFEKIKDILIGIQLGKITPEEQRMLEEWRKEKVIHERLYRRLMDREHTCARLSALEDIDVDKAFILNQKLLRRRSFVRVMYRSLPYAALLIFMIGIILLWPDTPRQQSLPLAEKMILPGSRKAELVLADGTSVHLYPDMRKTFQDGSSEVVVKGNAVNYTDGVKGNKMAWHIIRTPLGGEYSITLSDGTQVWLNAMSELKYPVYFDGKERRVELKGEAFFQVKTDTTCPFYVTMEDYRLKVLGTSFNVKAYDEDECWQATLCTGQINLSDSRSQETLVLAPGKQAVCHRNIGKMEVKEVDTALFTAWTKGEFRFDNTSIENIFTVLQRWYKIEVFYLNAHVRQEVFTGKLPRFDNLQVILEIMEKVSDLQFEMKGNTVFIK